MNLLQSFLLFSFMATSATASALLESASGENCLANVNTETCTTPNGEEGLFMCETREHDVIIHAAGQGQPHIHQHDHHRMSGNGHGHSHGHGNSNTPSGRARGLGHSHHMNKPTALQATSRGHNHDHPFDSNHALTKTHCVPVHHEPPFDRSSSSCGCCGGECPVQLHCGCVCDIVGRNGRMIAEGAGVWVSVTRASHHDASQTMTTKKCVRPGSYADPSRIQCLADTECPASTVKN